MTSPIATTVLNETCPDEVTQSVAPFRSFGKHHAFAAPIRTAVTLEDTRLVKEELYTRPRNDAEIVLVGGGSLRRALLGDLNGDLLARNDWAGIEINCAVRGAKALAEIDLGIKALGIPPVQPGKSGTGGIDEPLVFGNALLRSGQRNYCDQDGILISDDPLEPPM